MNIPALIYLLLNTNSQHLHDRLLYDAGKHGSSRAIGTMYILCDIMSFIPIIFSIIPHSLQQRGRITGRNIFCQ